MTPHCGAPLAPPWRILTTSDVGKAIAEPPAEATFSSWSATIGRRMTGKSPASSNATCGLTITSRSAMLVPPVRNRRLVWSVICWTRRSIPFDPLVRRSRFGVMRATGSRSSSRFLASTERVRSTGGRTIGPSGSGIASTRPRRSGHQLPHRHVLDRGPLCSARTGLARSGPGARSPSVQPVRVRSGLAVHRPTDGGRAANARSGHQVRVRNAATVGGRTPNPSSRPSAVAR